ncbi:MAG: LytTR family transcriptional regulator DNA-binding domain-containing protein [Clostridia bacterium]|nr:LytTR family transcriptional regulator DNA-binding domain-containing protein [Clostridia bacterium]
MKITIETPKPNEEDEIIVRCHTLDEDVMCLICRLKDEKSSLTAYQDRDIVKLSPKDIYYFEAVDNKVFACCEKKVYEIKLKLYEIEEGFSNRDFIRISKSIIVNLNKIKSVSPMFNGRFEAKLQNDEKIIISRQYVPVLKKALGI